MLEALDKLFPTFLAIVMVRHPADTLVSMVEQKRNLKDPYWGLKIGASASMTDLHRIGIEQISAAYRYALNSQIGRTLLESSRMRTIRYEDLVTHPDQVLNDLCAWAGLAPLEVSGAGALVISQKQRRRVLPKGVEREVRNLAMELGYSE